MKEYIATAKAGRRISGQPNPGVGNPIRLTAAQAAHELRMGTIIAADNRADRKAAAAKKPTSAERAAAKEAEASGETKPRGGRKRAPAKGAQGAADAGEKAAPAGDAGLGEKAETAAGEAAQRGGH